VCWGGGRWYLRRVGCLVVFCLGEGVGGFVVCGGGGCWGGGGVGVSGFLFWWGRCLFPLGPSGGERLDERRGIGRGNSRRAKGDGREKNLIVTMEGPNGPTEVVGKGEKSATHRNVTKKRRSLTSKGARHAGRRQGTSIPTKKVSTTKGKRKKKEGEK